MMCPTCQSKTSKVLGTHQRANGQFVRQRCCVYCGARYSSVEIDAEMFHKLIELLRARRDLDQQLLEVCAWGLHRDRQGALNKDQDVATVDTTASQAC